MIRQRILAESGLAPEEFEKAAAEALQSVDPLTYAGRLDSGRILMVNGRFDQVIPYKNAEELWLALGRPDWLIIPAGHYTASFFMPYIRHRVVWHLVKQLSPVCAVSDYPASPGLLPPAHHRAFGVPVVAD